MLRGTAFTGGSCRKAGGGNKHVFLSVFWEKSRNYSMRLRAAPTQNGMVLWAAEWALLVNQNYVPCIKLVVTLND